MKYDAVIVAAGSGSRMNLGYNKVLYELEKGVRVIDKSVSLFLADEDCARVIVVLSEHDYDSVILEGVTKVRGGATRSESVYSGLSQVQSEYVMIHDGARPFLKKETLVAIKECLETCDACLPAIPEKDSIKIVEDGYVTGSIEREKIWHAQTPQAFRTQLIRECLKEVMEKGETVTDDIAAVQLHSDAKIRVINGDEDNRKLTVIQDLNR